MMVRVDLRKRRIRFSGIFLELPVASTARMIWPLKAVAVFDPLEHMCYTAAVSQPLNDQGGAVCDVMGWGARPDDSLGES